jgi:D-3-phosphoglycerate dehydrogenase / 2-oxoglutarate reductase
MSHILCLNPISKIGLSEFTPSYQITDHIEEADSIIVRSAVMHDMILPEKIIAVARAGAGVNNIPLDNYAKKGVVVFNTPGANANAVKELIIAGMFLASRDIHGGMNWLSENQHDPEIAKTVEKVKSRFGGTEIYGKTIGIIGLGAIGMQLAKSCRALGMNVIGRERFIEFIDQKQIPEGMKIVDTNAEVFAASDFISLNVPLTPETKYMIDQNAFNEMKDGVVLLNFARDLLVNDTDLAKAIENGKVKRYVTDFPNEQTVKMNNVIAIPHLGASTEEAEDNCAIMAVRQLMKYNENGSIINSVNYPNIKLEDKTAKHRVLILHDASIDIVKSLDLHGATLIEKATNQKFGVFVYDTNQPIHPSMISRIEGVLRVRAL